MHFPRQLRPPLEVPLGAVPSSKPSRPDREEADHLMRKPELIFCTPDLIFCTPDLIFCTPDLLFLA